MEIVEEVKELKPSKYGYSIQVIYTYSTTNIAEYEQFKNSLGERLNRILVMRTDGETK